MQLKASISSYVKLLACCDIYTFNKPGSGWLIYVPAGALPTQGRGAQRPLRGAGVGVGGPRGAGVGVGGQVHKHSTSIVLVQYLHLCCTRQLQSAVTTAVGSKLPLQGPAGLR